jgi:hypothetical protein
MPAVVIPDEGNQQQHEMSLGVLPVVFVPWSLVLFANDLTPDATTVLADIEQPTFNGYGPVLLDPALWQFTPPASGCSHAQWGSLPYAWSVNGGPIQTIYGWAWIDTAAGVIRRIQRFEPTDIAPIVIGEQFTLPVLATFTGAECP